jgi:hypothetical protein
MVVGSVPVGVGLTQLYIEERTCMVRRGGGVAVEEERRMGKAADGVEGSC